MTIAWARTRRGRRAAGHGGRGAACAMGLLLVLSCGGGNARAGGLPAAPPARLLLGGETRLGAGEARSRLATLPVVTVPVALIADARLGVAGGAPGGDEALAGVVVLQLAAADPPLSPTAGGGAATTDLGLTVRAWAPWWEGRGGDALGDTRVAFIDPALDPVTAAQRLAACPDVVYAEPYFVNRLAAVPDDPRLAEQVNLAVVGAAAAWDVSRGEAFPETVAVIDAGIDIAHPDLAANVLLNENDPPNGIDDDGNGFVDDHRGWNFGAGADDPAAFATATPISVRHGTHVAGLIAAATNNGVGVAGLTWNDRLLCVAAGHPVNDDVVVFGYQGILYAAERGARIISCSWGRFMTASLLERAVLEHVTGMGVLVVAAAGNDGYPGPFYPAAYPEVLGVANVTDDGRRDLQSNYGTWVDLAAPGVAVLSLFPGGEYGRLSGTSMACPLVAGAAALVWGREPGLRSEAVAQRLRLTAQSLVEVAPDDADGLGNGRLDVAAALTWQGPGYRLDGVKVAEQDGDGDGQVEPGETISLRPRWRNVLRDGHVPVTITLSSSSPYVTVLVGEATLAPLPAEAVQEPDRALQVAIAASVPAGTTVPFTWQLTGSEGGASFHDRQSWELGMTPLYRDLDAGEVKVTLGGNGRLGFVGNGGGNGSDGLGVRYVPTGRVEGNSLLGNLLFEGALLLGTGPDRLSDAARYSADGWYRRDFNPTGAQDAPRGVPPLTLPGEGEQLARVRAAFRDDQAVAPLSVEVRWLGLAPLSARPPGVTLLLSSVINRGPEPLTGLRYGFFLDWDLNAGGYFPTFRANTTAWDAAAGVGLVTRGDPPDGVSVATALVPEGNEAIRFRAIANDGSSGGWGIYDGFLDREKWDAIAGDDGPLIAINTDVSQALAGGPVDLAPGDSVRFVLVIAAGNDPDAARDHAVAGRDLARRVFETAIWSGPAEPFALGLPYPNPWNGHVALPVAGNPLAPWELFVYDLRGRLLRRIGPRRLVGGEPLTWDGLDTHGQSAPTGTYLLRAVQGGQAAVRRAVLVR